MVNDGNAPLTTDRPAYTPGPWLVRRFPGQRGAYVVNSTPDEAGLFVGQVIAVETTAPETAANLRLISAGPDLLAACRAAFERLKAAGDPFTGSDWELGHRLSAAIGKATDPDYPEDWGETKGRTAIPTCKPRLTLPRPSGRHSTREERQHP